MDGYRFSIERQKLCIWLEGEKKKIESLPQGQRIDVELALERDFRVKLDRLYARVRAEFEPTEETN